LLWGVRIGVALILLTPLVISRYTPFPVVFPKTLYFQALVEVVFLFYALLLIGDYKKYLPRFSPILIALFVFTEVLLFASLRGFNFERSLWGTVERGEGLMLHLHLFALFFVLVGVFRKRQDWLNILRLTLLVSLPVGLAALAQKLGINSFYTDLSSGRVTATFGNAVFYGSYLVLIILLALFMGIFEKDKKWRILFWALTVFNIFLLVLTGTRGAWLGIAIGLFCFAGSWFLVFGRKAKERRQTFLFGIFVVLLFSLLFIVFSEAGYLPRTYILDRYESAWFYLLGGKDARTFVWGLGLDAWRASPFFGYGLESFNYVYDKYYDPRFLEMEPGKSMEIIPENIFFDRAHGKIIDTLESSGAAGLLSYLAVLGTAMWALFRGKLKRSNPFLPYALLALFVGYFVQNIFTFDVSSTYLIFILLLAFIDISSRDEPKPIASNAADLGVGLKMILRGAAIIIAAIVFLAVIVRPFAAYAKLIDFRGFAANGQTREALDSLDAALKGPAHTRFEVSYYGAQALLQGMQAAEEQGMEKEASERLKQRIEFMAEHLKNKNEALHMRAYMLIAGLYKSLYLAEKDPAYLEDEEKILGEAIKMNPQFPKLYQLAAEMRVLQDRLEEAQILLAKGYELDHNQGKLYEWLGMSFMEAGKKELGVQYLRKSLQASNFYQTAFRLETVWNLAKAYEDLGDWKGLADFYEEVIAHYPQAVGPANPQLFASLSTVYVKIGEKEKARETTERMLKLYPGLAPQAAGFLKELEEPQNPSKQ